MKFRFAPESCRFSIPSSVVRSILRGEHPAGTVEWVGRAADALNTQPHGVLFKTSQLRIGLEASRDVAIGIARLVLSALHARGAPKEMSLEVDQPQESRCIPGYPYRTLLPHHDSTHSTYLTPSLHDVGTWDPEMRHFSGVGITTQKTHKLYQGFFLMDPGEGISITGYYSKVRMLRRAYSHLRKCAEPTLAEVTEWAGANIRRAWERRQADGMRYLTHGAAFGSKNLALCTIPMHWAEADLDAEAVERFPVLRDLGRDVVDDTPDILRLWNHVLHETLGMSWEEVRGEFVVDELDDPWKVWRRAKVGRGDPQSAETQP